VLPPPFFACTSESVREVSISLSHSAILSPKSSYQKGRSLKTGGATLGVQNLIWMRPVCSLQTHLSEIASSAGVCKLAHGFCFLIVRQFNIRYDFIWLLSNKCIYTLELKVTAFDFCERGYQFSLFVWQIVISKSAHQRHFSGEIRSQSNFLINLRTDFRSVGSFDNWSLGIDFLLFVYSYKFIKRVHTVYLIN